MAKRKDLLLNESTISRMMGLAGIGSLANPFLKEQVGGPTVPTGDQEEEMDEMMGHGYEEEDDDEGHSAWDDGSSCPECGYFGFDGKECEDCGYEAHDEDEDELEEAKESCKECGKVHEGSCKGYMQESVRKSMKRLKKLLEQADAEPPAEELPPEPAPGGVGGDEMEAKIKEFVKKLGELVQETLGVEVTVEEGEPEGAKEPEGEEVPPAPMAEAINRLVNKVARRVKARLMEAKGEKDKAIETKRKMAAKSKEKMKMGALKEKQAAAKKKEMEMKKKKAAMAKKK